MVSERLRRVVSGPAGCHEQRQGPEKQLRTSKAKAGGIEGNRHFLKQGKAVGAVEDTSRTADKK
jgi:hypothetical protein